MQQVINFVLFCSLRDVWLCKICSETRDMWKKTGAWFFKGLPKYELPPRGSTTRSLRELRSTRNERINRFRMTVDDSSSDDDEFQMMGGSRRSLNERPIDSNFLRRMESLRLKTQSTHNDESIQLHKMQQPMNQFNRQISNGEASGSNQIGSHSVTDCDNDSVNSKRDSQLLMRCSSVSSSYSTSEAASMNFILSRLHIESNQISREPPLGWLEVSLLYTESDHLLDCSLLRARDLPAMDIALQADPYCKLNIITEFGTIKQMKWIQTRTLYKTRNPVFNETVKFFGVEPDELRASFLYIVILDEDKYGSDFLGVGKFPLVSVSTPGTHRMTVPLSSEDRFTLEAIASSHSFGSILLGLCYNTKKRSLVVQVKRCTDLMAKDNNGFSDPFVKL